MAGPHHRTRSYVLQSAAIRTTATTNPNTQCWRCGRTLTQHEPHHNGTPAHWTAGHINDGQLNGPLLPEASTCNYSAGARNRQHEYREPW